MIHYGVAEAADLSLTRGFAQSLKTVVPGTTRSEGVEPMFASMGQALNSRVQWGGVHVHPQRPGADLDASALAEVAAFLVSRETSTMTGSPVRADGGGVLVIA